jgi:hypothetical protein
VLLRRPMTFLLHTEAMNLLLVMAATQLTSPAGTTGRTAHPFLSAMMANQRLAPALVRLFIQHYIKRVPPPRGLPVWVSADSEAGVLSRAGAALLLPFTVPFRLLAGPGGSSRATTLSVAPLADAAILLLLVGGMTAV